jgi:Membrane bound beta barrel domain (DUF5777)
MKACSNDQTNTRPMGRVFWIGCLIFALNAGHLIAQEDTLGVVEVEAEEIKPVKNTFESIWLIDAQTVMVPIKGTLEADFQHRFGTTENGYEDLYGIFANSNIRFGVDYVPVDRLLVGVGFTKFYNLWDVYGKYAILRQMKGGGSAISLDYYVNAAVDTRTEENSDFPEFTDRWSFFHQVMIARKFSDKFSLQVSGNLSWFNYKEHHYDSLGQDLGQDKNAQISMTALARYKVSNTIAIIAEYDQPLTDQEFTQMDPNLSFGLELTTSAHAFQLFIGNYQGLVPQYNHTYNQINNPNNKFLIGFNITRLWNL